jgi:hypothetical protein
MQRADVYGVGIRRLPGSHPTVLNPSILPSPWPVMPAVDELEKNFKLTSLLGVEQDALRLSRFKIRSRKAIMVLLLPSTSAQPSDMPVPDLTIHITQSYKLLAITFPHKESLTEDLIFLLKVSIYTAPITWQVVE